MLRPAADVMGYPVQEGRTNKSSTSAADDLMPINNAPHVRRSAAGGAGSQGRGRAHTLPHDYGLQMNNNSPGCERRRRRQRLAQQYRNAAQKPAADMSQDIADVDLLDSELAISSTFPPSPCHSSFQPRRRLHSLDGGMATTGTDAEISNGTPAATFSVINGGHMTGPTPAEDATHQNCPGDGMSQNFRYGIQSSFPRKLVLVTAAVMAVCLVVSSVLTTGSQDHSLAINDHGQVGAGRYDPEVRFLPGMKMEIIARGNEDEDVVEDGGDRHHTPEAPSSEEVKRPDPPHLRAAQVNGNGRKKHRPRLAHARASFDPIMPSQGTVDHVGIGSSRLRNDFKKQSRKLPTFVLPPEETEGSGNSMKNHGSIEVENGMSWSKSFILVAMAVLCVQLLASLRRG